MARKLSRAEYVLLWASFLAIVNVGLELGIAGGIVMATLYFAFMYAQVGGCGAGVGAVHACGCSTRRWVQDAQVGLGRVRVRVLGEGGVWVGGWVSGGKASEKGGGRGQGVASFDHLGNDM